MSLCGSDADVCSSALLIPAILGCGRTEPPLNPLSEFAEPALNSTPKTRGFACRKNVAGCGGEGLDDSAIYPRDDRLASRHPPKAGDRGRARGFPGFCPAKTHPP